MNIHTTDQEADFASYFGPLAGLDGTDSKSDSEGFIEFRGIVPDIELFISYNSALGETPTLSNQGSDDNLDSDFELDTQQVFVSPLFNLTAGEIRTDIDLGILP